MESSLPSSIQRASLYKPAKPFFDNRNSSSLVLKAAVKGYAIRVIFEKRETMKWAKEHWRKIAVKQTIWRLKNVADTKVYLKWFLCTYTERWYYNVLTELRDNAASRRFTDKRIRQFWESKKYVKRKADREFEAIRTKWVHWVLRLNTGTSAVTKLEFHTKVETFLMEFFFGPLKTLT